MIFHIIKISNNDKVSIGGFYTLTGNTSITYNEGKDFTANNWKTYHELIFRVSYPNHIFADRAVNVNYIINTGSGMMIRLGVLVSNFQSTSNTGYGILQINAFSDSTINVTCYINATGLSLAIFGIK